MSNTRQEITAEIDRLERATDVGKSRSKRIHDLKEIYNELINQENNMVIGRLPDPLHTLPPELWPSFLPQTASELLYLTLVSNRWRDTILSIPILWSNINMDWRQEDYLSQVALGFTCSAPLNVHLTVDLPLEIWKEVAPMIVTERDRITSLNISTSPRGSKPEDAFEVLSDFGNLPNLTALYLPEPYGHPELLSSRINFVCHRYPVDDMLLARMPQLSYFSGCLLTTEQLESPIFRNFKIVYIRILDQDTIIALQKLSYLKNLHLIEEEAPDESRQSLPNSLLASVSTIESFRYYGHLFPRALRYIGSNLRQLNATHISLRQVPEVLVALQFFPRLCHLYLHINQIADDEFNIRPLHFPIISSLTALQLYFTVTRQFHQDQTLLARSKQARSQLFKLCISMMPAVEELAIYGEDSESASVEYIQSLRTLKDLIFTRDMAGKNSLPPLVLSDSPLESVTWHGKLPEDGILDLLRSPTLQKLSIVPDSLISEYPYLSVKGSPTILPRFRTSVNLLPNLTTLSLTLDRRLAWDLSVFPKLKTLEFINFIDHYSIIMAGDILEDLALQPNVCPELDNIHFRGNYVEWDLLILMLERRNLASTPRTTRIKSIHIDREIGYKLLRPITELLGGKFPHRDPLVEYSAIAIGRLIWNSTM